MSATTNGIVSALQIDTPTERLFRLANSPRSPLSLEDRVGLLEDIKTSPLTTKDIETSLGDRTRIGALGGAAMGGASLLALSRMSRGLDSLGSLVENRAIPRHLDKVLAGYINESVGPESRNLLGKAVPSSGISGKGLLSGLDINSALDDVPRIGVGPLGKHKGLINAIEASGKGIIPGGFAHDARVNVIDTFDDYIGKVKGFRSGAQKATTTLAPMLTPLRIGGLALAGGVVGAILSKAKANKDADKLRDLQQGITHPKDIALAAIGNGIPPRNVSDFDPTFSSIDKPIGAAAGLIDMLTTVL